MNISRPILTEGQKKEKQKKKKKKRKKTHQIQRTPNEMIPHTGTILAAAAADEDDAVLLDIVALSRDVGGDHAAAGQPHTRRLALPGVRLLRLRDPDFQTYPLLMRTVHVR